MRSMFAVFPTFRSGQATRSPTGRSFASAAPPSNCWPPSSPVTKHGSPAGANPGYRASTRAQPHRDLYAASCRILLQRRFLPVRTHVATPFLLLWHLLAAGCHFLAPLSLQTQAIKAEEETEMNTGTRNRNSRYINRERCNCRRCKPNEEQRELRAAFW